MTLKALQPFSVRGLDVALGQFKDNDFVMITSILCVCVCVLLPGGKIFFLKQSLQ